MNTGKFAKVKTVPVWPSDVKRRQKKPSFLVVTQIVHFRNFKQSAKLYPVLKINSASVLVQTVPYLPQAYSNITDTST